MQTRTNLQESIKVVLNYCNLQIIFRSQDIIVKSIITFASKTLLPKFFQKVWFTFFNVDYATNPIAENVKYTLL